MASEVPYMQLTVRSIARNILAQVTLRENSTLAELKQLVQISLGTRRELLKIVLDIGDTQVSDNISLYDAGLREKGEVSDNISLYDAGLREKGEVICETLKEPQKYDTVGDCAVCNIYRHLFYGYARCHPNAEPEPVTSVCQACGGQPENPYDDD